MNKRKKWIAGGLAILVVTVAAFLIFNQEDGIEAVKIENGPYSEKIVAVGQLGLSQETTLVAEVSGTVREITIQEGGILSAGSVLIRIDEGDLAYQLEEREAVYLDSAAQYNNLINFEYASAKGEYERLTSLKVQAEAAYRDSEKLYNEGAISKSSMLSSKTSYESALSQWTTARLRLEALGPGGSLRSAGASRLQGAEALYNKAKDNADNYRIAVPWDSVVLKTYVAVGDLVQQGQTLADIGSAEGFTVVADLDEKYFPYLSKGLPVSIFVGEERSGLVEGSVENITPQINPNTGTFSISIALPDDFPYQASNLTVNLEITLREIENAIQIPAAYLLRDKDGDSDPYVFVYQNGNAEKRLVKAEAGLSSFVLITEGLSEGDIVLSPMDGLSDGDRVNKYKEADAS